MYDIAILGGGSGGLVAASGAASLGAKVLLVENKKMGGDCLNYGCVPSKSFLKSAHLAKSIKKASKYGLNSATFETSLEDVMKRVQSVIKEIEPHDSVERFTALGVDVKLGHGKIVSPCKISVDNEIFEVKKIIIATGSRAFITPIKGLDTVSYYTNENIFSLKKLPKNMVVLGAGPIGLELGQGFCNLGANVHIIDRGDSLFKKDEPEVSGILQKAFVDDGLNLHFNSQIIEVLNQNEGILVKIKKNDVIEDIYCDTLLISSGRVPNTENLGLENVKIKTDKRGYIEVDEHLMTNIKGIYAVGDCKGKFMFTHAAGYEGSVAMKNALIANRFKAKYYNIPWVTYTSPQVGHVGLSEKEAMTKDAHARTHFLPIYENDRARADDDREGFIKVTIDHKGVVLGATIVSDKADEMLSTLALMVTEKIKLSKALNIIYPYPVQGEILKTLAVTDLKENATDFQRKIIKKVVTK